MKIRLFKIADLEINKLESLFESWRRDGSAYVSDTIFMGVEGIELFIKDLRGDLSAMKERSVASVNRLCFEVERKLQELSRETKELAEQRLNQLGRLK